MKVILVLFLSYICLSANVIIAIDIGHTPKKFGAISARGIGEYQFNKRIANELNNELQKNGFNSFLVNGNDEEIKLLHRTKVALENKADFFISLHHDSAQEQYFSKWEFNGQNLKYSDNFKGFSLLVSSENEFAKDNKIFAETLGTELLSKNLKPTLHHAEKIKGESRVLLNEEKGIYEFNNLAVLRTAKMPAILVECGVIVNRSEEENLNDFNFRKKIVDSIVNSMKIYFK